MTRAQGELTASKTAFSCGVMRLAVRAMRSSMVARLLARSRPSIAGRYFVLASSIFLAKPMTSVCMFAMLSTSC